jgi:signal transduction histidine kinase
MTDGTDIDKFVRHDINNALTSIVLLCEAVEEDFAENSSLVSHIHNILSVSDEMKKVLKNGGFEKEIASQLKILLGESEIIMALADNDVLGMLYNGVQRIKQISDWARVCRGNVTLREFVLNQVIVQEAKFLGLEIRLSPRHISFRADCSFGRVIGNLLQNAKRHGNATEISVSTRNENDLVVIDITDNGNGIAEENKEKIFTDGFTTKVGEPGGEGLALCRKILGLTGITIKETSHSGMGARFEISIPRDDVLIIS